MLNFSNEETTKKMVGGKKHGKSSLQSHNAFIEISVRPSFPGYSTNFMRDKNEAEGSLKNKIKKKKGKNKNHTQRIIHQGLEKRQSYQQEHGLRWNGSQVTPKKWLQNQRELIPPIHIAADCRA